MRVTRRQFCSAIGAASLATLTGRIDAGESNGETLRVIAYNIYACKGWPNDRPAAKKAVAEGRIARELAEELAKYDPDVINFSESPSESMTTEIARLLDMHHVRFPSGGNWPGTLLSRFEVLESQNAPLVGGERPKDLFTRHWGRAVIRLPDDEPLVVHSAHLYPTRDPDVRLREIPEMLKSMRADFQAGRSMLLIGDLNHTPDTTEHKLWTDAGWIDTFVRVGEGDGYTINAAEPSHRIDYVLAAGPIAGRVVESRPLFEGAFRLDPTNPDAYALSDHLPQLAVFER